MSAIRILVVDDEPLVLRVLKLALEKAGYEVDTQPNGLTALAHMVRQPPDALITDIEMPEMDGRELCKRVDIDFPNRQFPIFVATSLTSLEHRNWSDAVENLEFLEKPLSVRKLLSRLAEHFHGETVVRQEGQIS